MTTGTVDTARELAAFLRTRRERLDPDDFGLPARRRARRTPGLRREEVAELAGVSTEYIVRLEQARGLRPSAEVLEALSRALRLAPDERSYLFDLAQQRPAAGGRSAATAPPELVRLLADLSPLPAMVRNHRNDILAWNPEMARVIVDYGTLPVQQRNGIWLFLFHPELRDRYADRELRLRECIADLRATWAAHPDDAELLERIDEFVSGSPEFAAMWADRDVRVHGSGAKTIVHPEVGRFTVDFEALVPVQHPDHYVVIYRAADSASRAALDALCGGAGR
jgi:transcriptional regulator with XRE-family HTH domain